MNRLGVLVLLLLIALPSVAAAQKYSAMVTGAKERMNNSDYEKALELLMEAKEYADDDDDRLHEMNYLLGVVFYRRAKYRQALEAFQIAKANGDKYMEEGMNLTQVGFHPIPTYVESAMSLVFNNAKNVFNSAQTATGSGERDSLYAKVVEDIEYLLSIDPDYVNAFVLLGNTYNDLGNTATDPDKIKEYRSKAIAAYEKILKVQDNLMVYAVVGQLYSFLDNYEKSIETLEKAIAVKTDDKETKKQVLFQLINSYNMAKAYDRGINFFEELMKTADEEMVAIVIPPLAIFYDQTGKAEKAITMYKEALDKDSSNADLWYNLGRLYLEQKQYKKAISSFVEAKRLQPKDVSLFYLVADEYYFLCEKRRKETIEKLGDEDADDNKVFEAVKADYMAAVPHIEEAIEKLKIELMAKPEKVEEEIKFNHQIGRLYVHLALIKGYLTGPQAEAKERDSVRIPYYKEALPYLEKTVSLDPARKDDWQQLGQIYANLGRMEDAQDAFNKAE